MKSVPISVFPLLFPDYKTETDKAGAIVKLGWPAVEPVLQHIVDWVSDRNDPVAHVFAPFLIDIGLPVAPHIAIILAGYDGWRKYTLLVDVVANSHQLAGALRRELESLVICPTENDVCEEVSAQAKEILDSMRS
ncbi:DUF5071 domain-containing protein [Acetobacter sacchari]|uniref:DUF5071 domain-containing protein n=1 Tax=Acetobacter sacchari TaxID=2661687 RepID=A0ABS3M1M8_9PROT|nr:DUF5071 domain-containing protein [Acetobacter sacchari]MBO1362094.1 DUF5071 domain-containing protein [Acetobacter sacchari]